MSQDKILARLRYFQEAVSHDDQHPPRAIVSLIDSDIDSSGHCFSLSIIRGAMRMTGKLKWWDTLLHIISEWDLDIAKLDEVIDLPQQDHRQTRRELFSRALDYIALNQFGNETENFFSAPILNEEDDAQSTAADKYFTVFHDSKIHRISNSTTVSATFTPETLDLTLNEVDFTSNIGLIGVKDKHHTLELHYNSSEEVWELYDSNNKHPDKQNPATIFSDKMHLAEHIIKKQGTTLAITVFEIKTLNPKASTTLSYHPLIEYYDNNAFNLLNSNSISLISDRNPDFFLEICRGLSSEKNLIRLGKLLISPSFENRSNLYYLVNTTNHQLQEFFVSLLEAHQVIKDIVFPALIAPCEGKTTNLSVIALHLDPALIGRFFGALKSHVPSSDDRIGLFLDAPGQSSAVHSPFITVSGLIEQHASEGSPSKLKKAEKYCDRLIACLDALSDKPDNLVNLLLALSQKDIYGSKYITFLAQSRTLSNAIVRHLFKKLLTFFPNVLDIQTSLNKILSCQNEKGQNLLTVLFLHGQFEHLACFIPIMLSSPEFHPAVAQTLAIPYLGSTEAGYFLFLEAEAKGSTAAYFELLIMACSQPGAPNTVRLVTRPIEESRPLIFDLLDKHPEYAERYCTAVTQIPSPEPTTELNHALADSGQIERVVKLAKQAPQALTVLVQANDHAEFARPLYDAFASLPTAERLHDTEQVRLLVNLAFTLRQPLPPLDFDSNRPAIRAALIEINAKLKAHYDPQTQPQDMLSRSCRAAAAYVPSFLWTDTRQPSHKATRILDNCLSTGTNFNPKSLESAEADVRHLVDLCGQTRILNFTNATQTLTV